VALGAKKVALGVADRFASAKNELASIADVVAVSAAVVDSVIQPDVPVQNRSGQIILARREEIVAVRARTADTLDFDRGRITQNLPSRLRRDQTPVDR
jgi:hypothetical protein